MNKVEKNDLKKDRILLYTMAVIALLSIGIGSALIYESEDTQAEDNVPVTGIWLKNAQIVMNMNDYEGKSLEAEVFPSNATNKKINWVINDNTIASIDTTGNSPCVKPLKEGSTKILAYTDDGNYLMTCTVIVHSEGKIIDNTLTFEDNLIKTTAGSSNEGIHWILEKTENKNTLTIRPIDGVTANIPDLDDTDLEGTAPWKYYSDAYYIQVNGMVKTYPIYDIDEIIIEEGVIDIGVSTFRQTKITSITLPESVGNIEDTSLFMNYYLKNIVIINREIRLSQLSADSTLNDGYYTSDGILYKKSSNDSKVDIILQIYPSAKTTGTAIVPTEVTIIGRNSFQWSQCTGVMMPDHGITINFNVFNTSNIKSVGYTGSNKTVNCLHPETILYDRNQFSYCRNLTGTFDMSNLTMTDIPGGLFNNSGITEVILPNSQITINANSFGNSNTVTIFDLNSKDYKKSISEQQITGKTIQLVFQKNTEIVSIDKSCLSLVSLYNITYEQEEPTHWDDIKQKFYEAQLFNIFGKETPAPHEYFNLDNFGEGLMIVSWTEEAKKQTTLVIPDSIDGRPVYGIKDSAFNSSSDYNFSTLKTSVQKVIIGSNVRYIGSYAFNAMSDLEEVIFEDGEGDVTIGDRAFAKMGHSEISENENTNSVSVVGLKVFDAGTREVSLGANVFINDSSIKTINIPNVKEIGIGCFYAIGSGTTISMNDTAICDENWHTNSNQSSTSDTISLKGCTIIITKYQNTIPSFIEQVKGSVSLYLTPEERTIVKDDVIIPVKEGHIFKEWEKGEDGTYTSTWYIDISKANVTVGTGTYNGSAIDISVTVSLGKDLTEGTDYSLSFEDLVNAGRHNVTITGEDNYSGTIIAQYTIDPYTLNDTNVDEIAEKTYSGNQITPNVTVKLNESGLTKDTDFTVGYGENRNSGSGSVTITGKSNFTGTVTKTFTIVPKTLETTVSATDKTYDGTNTATVSVSTSDIVGNDKVTISATGTFAQTTVDNNINVTVSMTLSGEDSGNYVLDVGSKTTTANITKANYDMTSVIFESASLKYNGQLQNLTATGLPTGADGITVTVQYSEGLTDVGSKEITATFSTTSTNYNAPNTKTATLTITPADTTINAVEKIDVNKGESFNITLGLEALGSTLTGKNITVSFNNKTIGTVSYDNGYVYTYDPTLNIFPVGSYKDLVFSYAGEGNYGSSQTIVKVLIVDKTIVVEGNDTVVDLRQDEPTRVELNNNSTVTMTITDSDATSPAHVRISVEETTSPHITDSIKIYDITLNTGGKTFIATITLPATIPTGMIPIVKSYNDDGTVYRTENVVTWTNDSVTFTTDHNTLFAVSAYTSTTPGTDSDDSYQQWLQQYYQQLAEQQKQQQEIKEQKEQKKTIAVAVAGAAVIMLSVLALGITRRK